MTQTEYHVERPKNHWELDLEKTSLKEPALKSKYHWLKPLTVYHALEFRGNFQSFNFYLLYATIGFSTFLNKLK